MNHIRQRIVADIIHHEFRGICSQVENDWAKQIAIDVCPIDASNLAWFDWFQSKQKTELVKITGDNILSRLMELFEADKLIPLPVVLATLPAYFGKLFAENDCDAIVTAKQCRIAFLEMLETIQQLPDEQQTIFAQLIAAFPQWRECITDQMKPRPEFIAANLCGGEYIRQRRFAPKKASLRLPHNRIPDMRKSRKAKAKRARR